MADIIVTTLEDELDAGATIEAPGGDGLSLREAIALSVNGDTISFADDLEGTIRLDDPAGRLVLNSDISIFGDGRITISGDVEDSDSLSNGYTDLSRTAAENLNDNVQLFYATTDVTSVTFDGLTLTGGRSVAFGGGVIDAFNAELTVTNSVLAGNSSENGYGGGALYGAGAFTIENSTFIGNIATSGNGGAIDARGVATITGSTFSGNQAAGSYGGGAIYSTNTLDISTSTFDANTSTGGKGGGAVHSRNGGLLAVNTTFYANQALNGDDGSVGSGGAVYTYGGGYFNNVTATGNYSQFQGGGIFGGVESGLSGEGIITNSIILGNKANVLVAGAGNEIDGSLTFVVSDNVSNGDPAGVFADTTTITAPNGSTTFTAGVLTENGGPVETVALNSDPSNPALNSGGLNARLADARGIDSFGQRDIGAYEVVDDQNLVVTSLGDAISATDEGVTLREAVLAANARFGADTITFDIEGPGLIRLTEGELVITDSVTINGGGLITITGDANADDILDANGFTDVDQSKAAPGDLMSDNSRIFVLMGNENTSVLDGLTLTGGHAVGGFRSDEGGAVYADVKDFTISNSALIGNYAEQGGGAVYIDDGDTATLTAVTITDNRSMDSGGGVYSEAGVTTITSSNISRNRVEAETGLGGGVYADSALRIVSSTIAYNEIRGDDPFGGGVYNGGVSTEIISSTIVGNRTTGDFVDFPGLVSGAGVYGDYSITITDSIIVGNVASSGGPDVSEYSEANGGNGDGIITFTGQNIVGTNAAGYDTSALANVQNASLAVLFAGGLTDNGGPVQTIALNALQFNPALDAAGVGAAATDARGQGAIDQPFVDSPPGSGVSSFRDLGAYELTAPTEAPSLVVTTLTDGFDGSDGETTLREAIAFADQQAGVDTITFADDLGGLLRVSEGAINIRDGVIIDGGSIITLSGDAKGDDDLDGEITNIYASIDAGVLADNTRIFEMFGSGQTLTLTNIALTGGRTEEFEGRGGAIYADSNDIVLDNVFVSGNSASGNASAGGGALFTQGDVTVTDSNFYNNVADGSGGAIEARGAVTITRSELSNNQASNSGGAINTSGVVTIIDSTISANSTANSGATGGGVYSESGVMITGSTIANNFTSSDNARGGGVFSDGAIEITGSTVNNNRTYGESASGAGVFGANGVTATNSTFYENNQNEFDSKGGAIYSGGDLSLTHVTIVSNGVTNSGNFGGGAYFKGAATVANSIIMGNRGSGENGDLSDVSSSYSTLSAVNFVGNNLLSIGAADAVANIANVSAANEADVLVGGLVGLGEPVQTIALSSQLLNPALDAASTGGTDARGFARADLAGANNGGVADLGAFELQPEDDVFAPSFSGDPFIAVGETLLAGLNFTPVVATDLTALTYSIAGGPDAAALSIDPATGVLSFDIPVDFENPGDANGDNQYDVIIRATDQGGNSSTSEVFVFVSDVDEAPTITSGAAFTAAENQTLVGAVMASDDKTDVTFAITGGADAALFSINATNGALRFQTAPDFEAPGDAGGDNVHNIQITVTDSGGLTAVQAATVTVTDVNEAPVAAASSARGDEDTVISGALLASDVDGDALSFSVVSGPSNGSVTVNANGSFQFTPVADFNGTDSFTFRASDGALSDTATATITVDPVDEPVDPVDPPNPTDPPSPVDPPNPVDPPAPVGPTTGDDTLRGTALNDTINALSGNDNVNGLAGDDLLIGASGDDSIKGAAGDDRLRGGGGEDTLKGGGGADNIKGGGGGDFIRGNGGADVIRSGGGADNVNGGGGADLILGGGGADQLNGGGGADTLRGNGGNDTLKGNGGADVFQFRTSDRNDTISDFRQGQDKIEILNGAQSFGALSIEQDGRDVLIGFGVAGQIRVVTDNVGAFDENDFIF